MPRYLEQSDKYVTRIDVAHNNYNNYRKFSAWTANIYDLNGFPQFTLTEFPSLESRGNSIVEIAKVKFLNGQVQIRTNI